MSLSKTFEEAWKNPDSSTIPALMITHHPTTDDEKQKVAEATLASYNQCVLIYGSTHSLCLYLLSIYTNIILCLGQGAAALHAMEKHIDLMQYEFKTGEFPKKEMM